MRKILQVHTLNRKIHKNSLPNENKQVVASKQTEMDHKRESVALLILMKGFFILRRLFFSTFFNRFPC